MALPSLRKRLAIPTLLLFGLACAPRRPSTAPGRPVPLSVEDRGGVSRVGRSWLRWAGPGSGLLVGRFEGTPYALGTAFGRLTGPRIAVQEQQLEWLFRAFIPNGLLRGGLRQLFSFRLRGLADRIQPDLLLTIAGVADGYEPEPPASGWSAYRRMIDLHALHEVSQRFVDAPYLESYCTGFLATGKATRDGGVLLARNFDFEGGDVFDREKVVSIMVPAGKIPYLAVGFPGMVGVVSGFNREGIGVAVQSIAGGATANVGEPVSLLLADVLQSERTFEGAVERVRNARVFVSDMILLGDGKTGRIAVLEKTPTAFAVRDAGPGGWIAVTNEAEAEAIRRTGLALPPGSTSKRRAARLTSLLSRTAPDGGLDVPAAVAILRDRRGASGADLGPGNRNAIDALIAAHSVVFDLTARRAWVATAPHALGAYVPIDLDAVAGIGDPARLSTVAALPEDPLLLSGDYDRYLAARRALSRLRVLEAEKPAGWQAAAVREMEAAHAVAPAFVEVTARLGELLARAGARERALGLLDEALAHEPAPEPFARGIARLRDAVAAGGPLPPPGLAVSLTPDETIEETRARDRP